MKILNLLRLIGFTAIPITSYSKPINQLNTQLDMVIKHAIATKSIVGTVVIVSQNGQEVYKGAYGWQDRESNIKTNLDTQFRLASMTKPIVTVAVLKLIDEGKIQLNDPVTRFIPHFKPKLPNGETPTITIYNLLTHTAGLNYGFLESDTGPYHQLKISDGLDKVDISLQENIERLAQAPLLFRPGAAWNYSLATDVLGEVIINVTHQSLPVVIKQLVLTPLSMNHTGFFTNSPKLLATPYASSKPEPIRMREGQKIPIFDKGNIVYSRSRIMDKNAYSSGGAGMVGTADDYIKLLEAIRTGIIGLKKQSLQALTTNQIGNIKIFIGTGFEWTLGFSILTNPEKAHSPQGKGTYQWGGVWGNTWWVDPKNKISVVILTNTALEGMSGQYPDNIKKIIYKNLVK